MNIENLNKTAAWYHGVVDSGFTKYFCDANKSIVFGWIESQHMPISAASVISALQEAESNGSLGGSVLAIVPDQRALQAQREKQAADEAKEQERQRLQEQADLNSRFELISFCAAYRCSDPAGQSVERRLLETWDTQRLQAYRKGIELQRASKNQSAAEFSKAQGLDKIDVRGNEIHKGTGAVPLPADLTRAKFMSMRPAEIRIMVKKIAALGYSDRAIWAAINVRIGAQQ